MAAHKIIGHKARIRRSLSPVASLLELEVENATQGEHGAHKGEVIAQPSRTNLFKQIQSFFSATKSSLESALTATPLSS